MILGATNLIAGLRSGALGCDLPLTAERVRPALQRPDQLEEREHA